MTEDQPLKGEGAQKMSLKVRDNKVVLEFDRNSQWLAVDPQTAAQLSKQLLDAVVNCGYDLTIEAPRPKIIKAVRERMEARTLHILLNKREATENNNMLSKRIVDTLLNMLDL